MNNKFILRLRQCDHYIIAASLLLFLTGMAGLISVSRDDQTFLSREVLIQSVALILGLIAASAILTLGYRYFLDLEKIIYIAGIIFLLSVYIPGLGTSFYGSRSWLDLGFVTFQPSEPVKIAFVILMASYLSRTGKSLSSARGIVMAALYGLPFILIVSKEDFGSGCVFCAIWIFMVFCSGLDLKVIVRLALAFIALIPLFLSLIHI